MAYHFFNFLSTARACWLVLKLFKIETVLIADAPPDLFMLVRHTSGLQSTEIPNHLYDLSWPVPGCGLFHFYPYLPEGNANPRGSRIAVFRENPRGVASFCDSKDVRIRTVLKSTKNKSKGVQQQNGTEI